MSREVFMLRVPVKFVDPNLPFPQDILVPINHIQMVSGKEITIAGITYEMTKPWADIARPAEQFGLIKELK